MKLSIGTRGVPARRILLEYSSASPGRFEAEEREFFRSLCLPDGTHKTTAPARLRSLDELVSQLIAPSGDLHVLDVGISSGVTTLEWLAQLERPGRKVTGLGIDIRIHAFLRRCLGADVLFDPDGHVLQVAFAGFARGRPDPAAQTWKASVLRLVFGTLERSLVRSWRQNLAVSTPVALLCPKIRERAGFVIEEHDVREPLPSSERYDVIRAANVLNLSYFQPHDLASIVSILSASLEEGGLFAVCRTHADDGQNHGTVYRKTGGRLCVAGRVGDGSELEGLLAGAPSRRTLSDGVINRPAVAGSRT